jgi:adenylyltransferase/sulfurtransferase
MTESKEGRYSRQVLFAGIGPEGQDRIRKSHVAVVGCGALGTVSSEMLARAGTGQLTIIDRDFVEWSNLQRQSLFTEADAGASLPKAVAAERALSGINSEVQVNAHVNDLSWNNIEDLLEGADLILDGSDNFEVRFLLNDFSVHSGIPWIYGAALGSYGLAMAVVPGSTACLQCLFPEMPTTGTGETCDTAGILAPVIHIVTGFQVTQALRILTGNPPLGGLFTVDVWQDLWRRVRDVGPRDDCRCCRDHQLDFLDGRISSATARLCGRNAVQVKPVRRTPVDLAEVARQLGRTLDVRESPYLIRFESDQYDVTFFQDGRAIIKGTDDPGLARALYARFFGG